MVRTGPRERLVRLLNYVEQVIRLDEKVALELSDYRLPDGSAFAFTSPEHRDLPGVRLSARDDEGPIWLEVARLARQEPPSPPAEIADWIVLSSDPAAPLSAGQERPSTGGRRFRRPRTAPATFGNPGSTWNWRIAFGVV